MLEVAGEINSGLSGDKTSNEPHRHSHTQLIAALFKGRTTGLGWRIRCLKREKRQKIAVFSLMATPREVALPESGMGVQGMDEGWLWERQTPGEAQRRDGRDLR